MASHLGYQLKALGRSTLPMRIRLGERLYRRMTVFKHDFFAATAAYELEGAEFGAAQKVVLKIHRCAPLWGWSMTWLGNLLSKQEIGNLKRLSGLEHVPRLLARYEKNGLVYEYIEGRSLDEKPELSRGYFDSLALLLEKIHQRNMAYVDLNKRGNILVLPDGNAALIDFQIAIFLPRRGGWFGRLTGRILGYLQAADRYHLLKHKRRLQKKLLTDVERAESCRVSGAIKLHRKLVLPITRLRRRILGSLYEGNHLALDDTTVRHPESCPERWRKI